MKHRNAAGLLAAAGMALCALSPAKAPRRSFISSGCIVSQPQRRDQGDGEISGNFVDGGRL